MNIKNVLLNYGKRGDLGRKDALNERIRNVIQQNKLEEKSDIQHDGYFGTDLKPRSDDEDDASAGIAPLQASEPHQRENVCPPTYDLAFNRSNPRWIFSGIVLRTWNPLAPKLRLYHLATVATSALIEVHYS
ncbi:hypothetical protein AVEN_128184-1 [Araneus ventricosus]|uniref:Uncharacterized protein n=1 Tax=Araneus ventricosus TaxID=182803 RepID=A0A4Y1ZZW1_ARAVE|nr:hypothetical protein AVEN_128184-1 [Araneus ventricosus]